MTDVTSTAAWTRLAELRDALTPDLRGWFAADPERGTRFARTAGSPRVVSMFHAIACSARLSARPATQSASPKPSRASK